METNAKTAKWYFKTYMVIIAFLAVGPFMLPLVWANPRYTPVKKAAITTVILVISYFIALYIIRDLKAIYSYYQQMLP